MGTRRIEFEESNFGSLMDQLFGGRPVQGIVYVAVSCCACNVPFCLHQEHHDRLRQSGDWFYCPSGHAQRYGGGEVEKLKKQLAQEAKQREALETDLKRAKNRAELARRAESAMEAEKERVQRSLYATRAVVTKLKKRAEGGLCPCCDQHFSALQEHMKAEHPDYADQPSADEDEGAG